MYTDGDNTWVKSWGDLRGEDDAQIVSQQAGTRGGRSRWIILWLNVHVPLSHTTTSKPHGGCRQLMEGAGRRML
jgi:hypothetical protein